MKNKLFISLLALFLVATYMFNASKNVEQAQSIVLQENQAAEKNNQRQVVQSEQSSTLPKLVDEEIRSVSTEQNPDQIIERPASAYVNPVMEQVCQRGYQQHFCEADITKDLESLLFDQPANAVNLQETHAVIQSENFNEVITHVTGNLSEHIIRSEQYNLQANDLITTISGVEDANIGCGKVMCAAEFNYTNEQGWQSFESRFFDQNKKIGNVVAMPINKSEALGYNQMRVIFFLGQGMSTSLGSSK